MGFIFAVDKKIWELKFDDKLVLIYIRLRRKCKIYMWIKMKSIRINTNVETK
ncbi:hypothetical protein bsdtb5_40620 [Anaeromicropila herbilytica]|uniref:Uncharacterized protein n=1 Tax=Anaeromicropila herbilytica TaxID=2785025 RepID=A0A7R7IEL5_9FIRM|nr:hypothetical protein bsdtb5_40620 [Anaeromicropila herbilytica]